MPLDPNIILQGQQPQIQSPLDAMGKAMTFRDLADRTQLNHMQVQQAQQDMADKSAMRQAYANNMTVGPNGAPVFNRSGMASSLAQQGSAHLIPQLQQQLAQMDNETLKAATERTTANAQLLNGVTDQNSYSKVRQQALSMGSNPNDWPEQYDPGYVRAMQMKGLTYQQAMSEENARRGLDIQALGEKNKAKQLGMEMFKTYGAAGPGMMGGGGSGARGSGSGKNPAGPQEVDPSTLVPRIVPPDRQKDVFEEIKRAQNIGKNGPEILKAFDQAAEDNTVLKTGAGLVRTPGSVMALHQMLLPNFKTIDGTVRQAAMDETFHNVTPQPGDTDAKKKLKRKALINWMTSESAAPTAKGFGLDLSKYPSTSIDPKVLAGTQSSAKDIAIHPALKDLSLDELKKLEAQMSASKVGQK